MSGATQARANGLAGGSRLRSGWSLPEGRLAPSAGCPGPRATGKRRRAVGGNTGREAARKGRA